MAAPSAPPASLAAGWTNRRRNGPSRKILSFATQLRATPAAKSDLRALLGLAPDRDTLLYVGRLLDDKNVLELLDVFGAVKKQRAVQLAICYHFTEEKYQRKCRERAESIGDIKFIYKPDGETLIQCYNAADLLVSTAVSIFETFGRAPVEAMACGTPPVVAEYDGFRETITPSTGFLVPPIKNGLKKSPDIHRFAETILAALANPRDREKKSAAGVQHAQNFEEGASIRGMLTRLERFTVRRKEERAPCREYLSLEGYPPEITDLWSPLEGEPLSKLVTEFLSTWKVPIQPSDATVGNFFEYWFEHY